MSDHRKYWFYLNPCEREPVAIKYQHIPLNTLELSIRTQSALLRHDVIMDVATLLRADDANESIERLGTKALNELNSRLMSIIENQNIDQIRTKSSAHLIKNDDNSSILKEIGNQSIGCLHLSRTEYRSLSRLNVHVLEDIATSQFSNIKGITANQLSHINVRVNALCYAFDANKRAIDWERFCKSQKIDLIPYEYYSEKEIDSILSYIPSIVKEILMKDSNERDWHVIERRFKLDGREKDTTLKELGIAFNRTRERIRQIEEEAINDLRSILLEDDYTDKTYHVRTEVTSVIKSLNEIITEMSISGVSFSNIYKRLMSEHEINTQTLDSVVEFLIAISNLHKITIDLASIDRVYFISPLSYDLPAVIRTLYDLFTTNAVSFNTVDILIEVNRDLKSKPKNNHLSLDQLRDIISLCDFIEKIDDDRYRSSFEFLKSDILRIERLFLEINDPVGSQDRISLSMLCREMNHRLVQIGRLTIPETRLSTRMSSKEGKEKFIAIGNSGYWSLISSNVETATIVEHIKRFLVTRNSPATVEQITSYIRERRVVSDASVKMYLNMDPLFAQATRDTWGISDWNETDNPQTWNPSQVADFIEREFGRHQIDEIDYRVLKNALMKASGLSDVRVMGLLNSNPAIKTRKLNWKDRVAIFQPDYKQYIRGISRRYRRRKPTVFELISKDALSIIQSCPDRQIEMRELVKLLIVDYGSRYKDPYRAIHSWVSRMDFIEKFPMDGNNKLIMCRLKDDFE